MVNGVKGESIYDKIGWTGLFNVVWNSTPYPVKIIALPYSLCIYRGFLKGSVSIHQVLVMHSKRYLSSRLFRLLRPRYHKAKHFLKYYGIKT